MSDFEIKDSGERAEFEGGMQRDTAEGKIDYTLIRDGVMFERWAKHLTIAGNTKYGKRNWLKGLANPEAEERWRESAARHFEQWYNGDDDEDHAAAVFFNINGYETSRLATPRTIKDAYERAKVEREFRNGVGAGVYGEGDVIPDPTQ